MRRIRRALVAMAWISALIGGVDRGAANSMTPVEGARSTGTSRIAAQVFLNAPSPCVRRGITWLCLSGFTGGIPFTADVVFDFGNPEDHPVFGDWDGDGNRTPAVFRSATISWYLTNTNTATDAPLQLSYGSPGDIPLAGDWDDDGDQTIGVYRPSNATFYLRNSNTSGVADVTTALGNPGDIPLAGKFDTTSASPTTRDLIGVYRPSNATFYLTHSAGPVTERVFGNAGDRPITGAFFCSSLNPYIDVIGVFRPSTATWYGFCVASVHNAVRLVFSYGDSSDLPLVK